MRVPSGKTDQYIYFIALDATDLKTREAGLSSFTVYRSRNGAAEVAYTSPTIVEIDATNMPGVYALLLDEDTTIASGSDSEEYCVHITHAGMDPVTRTIELYRRDTTSGRTLSVESDGDLTKVNTLDGHTAQTGDTFALANGASGFAAVKAETALIVADTNELQTDWANGGRLDLIVDAILDDTDLIDDGTSGLAKIATDVAAILVDTAVIGAAGAGLTEAGGTGDHLTAITSKTDNLPSDPADASVIAGRFDTLDTAVADLPTSAELATALGTADDAVLAQVALVKAKTDNLPSDPADASDIAGAINSLASSLSTILGHVDTEVAAILEDTGTTIPAQIAALNNISPAEVNAEVVDALNVDTYAEPGQGAPGATLSLAAKIGFLFKAWRNRSTQTASEYALYADDAVTKDQEAACSDDGTTFVRGEVATGA